MISLVALIVLMIGGLNWFCIGALQYDFVAGLFGSQANIFSRLVYVLVGISSILVGYFAIKNKGKVVSFQKMKSMLPKKEKQEQESTPIQEYSIPKTDYHHHDENHATNTQNTHHYHNNSNDLDHFDDKD